ncbi:3158_t:CDS:2, partial [Acaulospora morrowiae]
MSPSSVHKLQNSSYRKDAHKPSECEEIKRAYAAGDYTTTISLLTSLLDNTAWEKVDVEQGYSREHLILMRAICFQQLREFEHVLSDTTEVLRSSPNNHYQLILAFWLRSLAHESYDKWEKARKDLEDLKSLIIESGKNIASVSEEVIFSLLPCMAPLFNVSRDNTVTINLGCVLDRLRRVTELVNKEIARLGNMSQTFRLIDNDASAFGELTKKFHYRLLLRRPVHPHVHVNMWYTMDLMFSSEMGLFKKEDMQGIKGYALEIKLLNMDGDDQKVNLKVEVRPMSVESCEWSGLDVTEWAGVQAGGKGGLEFRVVNVDSKALSSSLGQKRFLYIYPNMKMVDQENGFTHGGCDGNEHELSLVPLVVGPIHIVNCNSHFTSCINHKLANGNNYLSIPDPTSPDDDSTLQGFKFHSSQETSRKTKCSWGMDNYLVHNYRAFILPNEKYLLIKELWDVGIPGKVWDSAFIVVQMFKDRIFQDPRIFRGKRILDLSTGTGFAGLYLASLVASLSRSGNEEHKFKTSVILTDLEHALNLIRANYTLNKKLLESKDEVIIEIKSLKWGDRSKAKNLGVIDYVIASDVVYEPDLFDSLIQTFVTVCTPGRTKIYLGYKRRGLTVVEEKKFFAKLQKKFKMSSLQGLPNVEEESQV